MSYLRSSPNYIWNTSSVLGKGATGSVFAGLNKHNGDSVAVKSFNHLSHMRPYEVQKREFEVLKKVNHQNIVKLLAIEEEVGIHFEYKTFFWGFSPFSLLRIKFKNFIVFQLIYRMRHTIRS
jgi:serine/threonine protein kinase